MKLQEAIAAKLNPSRVDEEKTLNITKYVYSFDNANDDKPKKIENSIYNELKKKGVGAIIVADDAAPGTKRVRYVVKKIGSDKIELVQERK